jgi:predicted RNA-binding protein with PIN domain
MHLFISLGKLKLKGQYLHLVACTYVSLYTENIVFLIRNYMILVIDAYNVLKQALKKKEVSEAAKKQFINQLAAYAKKKGHGIVLVFDGGSYEWPSKERINGIYVVHSGIHESADAWIKKYLDSYKSHNVLLISTDRELGAFASRLGVQSLDASAFYSILQEVQVKPQQASVRNQMMIKTSKEESQELDELMRQSSATVQEKAEDLIDKNKRKSKAQQLSKKERDMLKKLKKL